MTESGGAGSHFTTGVITSLTNERIKRVRRLGMKKHRKAKGQVLVEGVRTLTSALAAELEFDTLFCSQEFLQDPAHKGLLIRAGRLGAKIFSVNDPVMDRIANVASSQGVVGVVNIPVWTADEVIAGAERAVHEGRPALLVWCDRLSDPGNLGTIIRTAHGLGAAGYFTSPNTVEVFNPASVRAAAGSSFFLPGAEDVCPDSVFGCARSHGYQVVATAARDGMPLQDLDPAVRTCVLVGEEAEGLSADTAARADVTVTIPTAANVESLNVAAATAIILHHLSPLRG